MPAKWRNRFRPEVPLKRIAAVRTRDASGKASFTGWDLDQSLPLLHSMIDFPPAARELDHANLIWKAVANDPGTLTKVSFLEELNRQIRLELATREETFHVLTTVSLDRRLKLRPIQIDGVRLRFYGEEFPVTFRHDRKTRLEHPSSPAKESPGAYQRVVASVVAKSASAAFTAASRAVDLYRSLWCFFSNTQMELLGQSWIPINLVRLGPAHTVHRQDGRGAMEEFWFEPHHVLANPYRPNNAVDVEAAVRKALKRIKQGNYAEDLLESLLMYVRALDEWNQNTALMRLWTALERLCSPGIAVYDDVIRRCAFLWDDVEFATQTLEHLREVRNASVHRGRDSKDSKTYCFQLQQQYRALIRFHIGRSRRFRSLQEANDFLDQPPAVEDLKRRADITRDAMRFRKPRSTPGP